MFEVGLGLGCHYGIWHEAFRSMCMANHIVCYDAVKSDVHVNLVSCQDELWIAGKIGLVLEQEDPSLNSNSVQQVEWPLLDLAAELGRLGTPFCGSDVQCNDAVGEMGLVLPGTEGFQSMSTCPL
jgi:hypothetical protein